MKKYTTQTQDRGGGGRKMGKFVRAEFESWYFAPENMTFIFRSNLCSVFHTAQHHKLLPANWWERWRITRPSHIFPLHTEPTEKKSTVPIEHVVCCHVESSLHQAHSLDVCGMEEHPQVAQQSMMKVCFTALTSLHSWLDSYSLLSVNQSIN